MKWKYVFNSDLYPGWYGHVDKVIAFVKPTGYKFFTFNGTVYSITGEDTGIPVSELI